MKNQGMVNTKTVKQYLIDITLKTLEINIPTQSPAKAICQIHYGDNYLKLKLQPTIKNNLASFYQQRIRIPYSSQVALVFKIQKMKKEIFLGHCMIDAQKSLQNRVYSFKTKHKLQQTDAYIDFEVKIIDKQLFVDNDSNDEMEDDDMFPNDKSNYSAKPKSKFPKDNGKSRSLINSPLIVSNLQNGINLILPSAEQFSKSLIEVQEIVKKHQLYSLKEQKLKYFKKDSKGKLQTQKILKLKNKLKNIKQSNHNNNTIIIILIGLISFCIGWILH